MIRFDVWDTRSGLLARRFGDSAGCLRTFRFRLPVDVAVVAPSLPLDLPLSPRPPRSSGGQEFSRFAALAAVRAFDLVRGDRGAVLDG
jgi:hypothetical protein